MRALPIIAILATMLRIFTDLIETLGPTRATAPGANRQHTLELATAVLLIEVVRADGFGRKRHMTSGRLAGGA